MFVVDPWGLLFERVWRPAQTPQGIDAQSRRRNALTRSMSSRTPSIVRTEQRGRSTIPVARPAFVHARGTFIVEPSCSRILSMTLLALMFPTHDRIEDGAGASFRRARANVEDST